MLTIPEKEFDSLKTLLTIKNVSHWTCSANNNTENEVFLQQQADFEHKKVPYFSMPVIVFVNSNEKELCFVLFPSSTEEIEPGRQQ